jgi:Flp pilus assembly pilin Flp
MIMTQLKTLLVRFVREEEGAAASEYAILVALIATAVAAAVALFDLGGIFTAVGLHVQSLI